MHDELPFDEQAKQISVRLSKGDDHVVAAALMLVELYDKYRADPSSKQPWEAFAQEHFSQWSVRYIYKLIEIGKASDPAEALRAWREASLKRSREARQRAGKPAVRTSGKDASGSAASGASATTTSTAEDVWREYQALSPSEKKRFDNLWRAEHEPADKPTTTRTKRSGPRGGEEHHVEAA